MPPFAFAALAYSALACTVLPLFFAVTVFTLFRFRTNSPMTDMRNNSKMNISSGERFLERTAKAAKSALIDHMSFTALRPDIPDLMRRW